MPWINVTEDNWQEFFIPIQDMQPEALDQDRTIWLGDEAVSDSDPESLSNSMTNLYYFSSDIGGPDVTFISGIRVTATARDNESLGVGESYNLRTLQTNSEVVLEDGTIVDVAGEQYPESGGIGVIHSNPSAGYVLNYITYRKELNSVVFEFITDQDGGGLFQVGSSVINEVDGISTRIGSGSITMQIQVLVDDVPPEPVYVRITKPSKVYELDKGWSFDGNYIPHFLELNWYFGDAPVNYHGMQKVRIHGLSKGWAKLQVQMAGMQTEYDSDYMKPQYIDLPKAITYVLPEFKPTTNYADYSVRGLSIQLMFSGRNEDLTLPEPSHVIQVLVTQSTPMSTGFRAN